MKLSEELLGQEPAGWASTGPGGAESSGAGVDRRKRLLKVFRLYFTVIDTNTDRS